MLFQSMPTEKAYRLVAQDTGISVRELRTYLKVYRDVWKPKQADLRRKKRKYTTRVKHGELVCQCGCGQVWHATWTTCKPKYINAAHRQRAYRLRQAEKAIQQEGMQAL